MTGAKYLKEKYPNAKTGIGANVTKVQEVFSGIFNYTEDDLKTDGSQFDVLFKDGDTFQLGEISGRVINTPGHTPACVCYVLGDAVFTGDTIFMPDFGTARCDFPGGSSSDLYTSVRRLYDELSDDVRVFVGKRDCCLRSDRACSSKGQLNRRFLNSSLAHLKRPRLPAGREGTVVRNHNRGREADK